MTRAAAIIAERERFIAAAARATPAEVRAARRAHFIRVERLSPAEAAALRPGFDPGPDYNPTVIPQEIPAWS